MLTLVNEFLAAELDILRVFRNWDIVDKTWIIYVVGKTGNLELMRIIIRKSGDEMNWNNALYGACQGGHVDVIRFVLDNCDNYAEFNAISAVCESGNMECVQLIIDRCVPTQNIGHYWNCGLSGACRSGNEDLVRMMIEKITVNSMTLDERWYNIDWGHALYGACTSGNVCIAQMIIEHPVVMALSYTLDLSNGLYFACRGGHMNTVKLMLEKGANIRFASLGLLGSGGSGKNGNEILKMLLDRSDSHLLNLADVLFNACESGNIEMIRLLISRGANAWKMGLDGACIGGHMDIAKMMIEFGANDWDSGLENACVNDNYDIIELMIKNGATYCENCSETIGTHLELVEKTRF